MRFFLSYKFTNADKNKLRGLLELVTGVLEQKGLTSFSFFRDIQKWGSIETNRNKIIPLALNELQKSDALLVIIDADAKSTGMGIEVGYAAAKDKPIYVLKRQGIKDDYIESIAQSIEEYADENEIQLKLKNFLEKTSQHLPR